MATPFPDPSESPWTNPDNGILYEYDNGIWIPQSVAGDGGGDGGSSGGGGGIITSDGLMWNNIWATKHIIASSGGAGKVERKNVGYTSNGGVPNGTDYWGQNVGHMNGMHGNQQQRIPAILFLRSPDGTLKQKKNPSSQSCTKKEWASFDYAKGLVGDFVYVVGYPPGSFSGASTERQLEVLDAIDAWVEAGNPWPV